VVNDKQSFTKMEVINMEKILTVPEVAQYLKISKSKMYDIVKREKIPFIKIGRNVRIKESDLDEWLEIQTRPGDPHHF